MKNVSLKAILILSAIGSLGISHGVHAATYYFDYTYDGSSTFINLSAAGSAFVVGDTIEATYRAAGTGYWTAPAGAFIWTPQGIDEPGTRVGDLSWVFSDNGSTVDSGSANGLASAAVHIPQNFAPSVSILFDKLVWEYTLTSSDAATNTLNGFDFGFGANLGYFDSNIQYVAAAPIPEPETYAMLLAGLGMLGFAARRRKQKEGAAG